MSSSSQRRRSSKAAAAASTSHTSSTNSTYSVLEQIAQLRNFCENKTDYELTDCLKQCGYNVERAAEQILTGQYRSSSSCSFKSKPILPPTTTATKPATKDDFRRHEKMVARTTKSTNRLSFSNSKSSSSSNNSQTTTPLAHSSRGNAAVVVAESSKATAHPTKAPVMAFDDTTLSTTPTTTNLNHSSHTTTTTTNHTTSWILCQRWLSDAICTTRHGSTTYQESLAVHCTHAGVAVIRWRGAACQGKLPEPIARLLAPVLRRGLVQCTCMALMAIQDAAVGAHIPIQLTVQVPDPAALLRVFGDDDDNDNDKSSSVSVTFLERRKPPPPLPQQQRGSKKELPLKQAVFDLLQWAEYGDVPDFSLPDIKDSPLDSGDDKDDNKESRSDQSSSSCINSIHKQGISGSNSHDKDDDENDKVNEEEFETDSVATSQGQEINKSIIDTTNNNDWSTELPQEDEPAGFVPGLTLRPYQKQALYWMLQREQQVSWSGGREQLEEQLQLLSELAEHSSTLSSSSRTSPANHHRVVVQGIVCDCGPVQVSPAEQIKSPTLDGVVNPVHHPLWKRRFLASHDKTSTISFFVNELLGVASHQPPEPPKPCSGGILADQMGLGKTVVSLALILKSKELAAATSSLSGHQQEDEAPTTTLVVAKLSVLAQWEEELKTKTNLSHLVYYGGQTVNVDNLRNVDVVVTTYGTIQGDFNRKNPVLLKVPWLRVILDEAHCIRNQNTGASKACCQLQATHRWCVSGTIVQNSLEDVYGIMKFLRHEPWCLSTFWKAAITKPMNAAVDGLDIETHQENAKVALDRVRRLLMPIMIRRTKDSLTRDGKPILTLPEKEVKTIHVELSETEREFYNALLARSLTIFDGFMKDGKAATSYIKIFALLSKLRQVCDHIALTVQTRFNSDELKVPTSEPDSLDCDDSKPAAASDEGENSQDIGKDFLEGLLDKFCSKQQQSPQKKKRSNDADGSPAKRPKQDPAYVSQVASMVSTIVRENATHLKEDCAICLDTPRVEDAVLTPCAHIFCRECLVGFLRKKATPVDSKPAALAQSLGCPDGECPNCNEMVQAKRIIVLVRSADDSRSVTTKFLLDTTPKTMALAVKQEVRETLEGNRQAVARQILKNAVRGTTSSKMMAIMKELDNVWTMDPGSKVLVFSHYLGFLDLFQMKFREAGIPYFRLDGSLTLKERMTVLEQFRNSSIKANLVREHSGSEDDEEINRGTVLLMSMSAGAEGLNLVSASSCFICDPWWNGAKEDQCANRILRIGQLAKVVRVRKFVVQESVEERIVQLQTRKQYVADGVYSQDNNDNSGEMGNTARLGLEEFRMIFQR